MNESTARSRQDALPDDLRQIAIDRLRGAAACIALGDESTAYRLISRALQAMATGDTGVLDVEIGRLLDDEGGAE